MICTAFLTHAKVAKLSSGIKMCFTFRNDGSYLTLAAKFCLGIQASVISGHESLSLNYIYILTQDQYETVLYLHVPAWSISVETSFETAVILQRSCYNETALKLTKYII